MLVNHQSGARALVMSDVGGTAPVSGLTFTLDDQAGEALPVDRSPAAYESYRPANATSDDPFPAPAPSSVGLMSAMWAFNGTSGAGVWAMYLVDDSGGATGSLDGWSVDITTTGVSPYPSMITVTGAPKQVTDVDVVLTDLSHESSDHVDLLLVGPTGAQTTIMSDVPSVDSPNNVDLTLDDEASSYLQAVTPGVYRPTNIGSADSYPAPAPIPGGAAAMSVFDGTDPNGTWRLFAVDDTPDDPGSLEGWSLRISTLDPPAAPQSRHQPPAPATRTAPSPSPAPPPRAAPSTFVTTARPGRRSPPRTPAPGTPR
jgi:subtilisin-like proprotein convertase family protein